MISLKRKNKFGIFYSFGVSQGFSLIELVVTVTIFAILTTGVLSAYQALTLSVKKSREQITLSSLASNYMEIVRNLPYSQVGTISGNPTGVLPDVNSPKSQTIEGAVYKIYYEITYIDDPADGTILQGTDANPNDYKQVKLNIQNLNTGKVTYFVTNVVPKGLENTITDGAMWVKVFDSQGQPVSGAFVDIYYPTTTPTMILHRQTDSSGNWIEVGLPVAVNNYHVVVSKAGYSTDQTYPISATNPNPAKPDPTIVAGQVTQVSFSIDALANLTIKTLNNLCQPISGVNLNVQGSKLIGTNPNVFKFNQNFTSSGSGQVALNSIEWDTYTPTLLSGQSYIISGTSPIQNIDVLPGTSQTFTMILSTNSTANSLLVIVKDAASGAALENANVHLQKGGSQPQDYYGITGGSVWLQSSWVGGSGYVSWSSTTPNQYFQDDGNIDINSAPTGVRLKKISGDYKMSGWLESATFDTGTGATNYTTLTCQPTSQDPSTVLKFQVAANNDNATWNYVGPDGTNGTYYVTSGSNISNALDNKRYVRYKVFLSTTNNKKTPVLTSLNVNFVTGCFTPGQVIFLSLTAGQNYNLDVSLPGYSTQTISSLNINGNQTIQVLMSP